MPGNGVTSDPVAMRMFLVLTSSLEPSSFVTVTSLGDVMLPSPLRWVTWTKEREGLGGGGREGEKILRIAHIHVHKL
jgi:hypothetical protein